eukprot:CAMPEP_0202965470 /NCGR_PEP_ID=MMETSP1396-20130829/9436_1 /ASSEMBLY_ACC=CAM_ASM_000872 /TAXON_ID= /ORGANISM="Pseudokeronopsis sp., Strain Brazil" /LENGTH=89 /DNA_ID=CAMNT_0049688197 /DNA_START=54 /DNA_END=323 /DNA_ORIENTATION=+
MNLRKSPLTVPPAPEDHTFSSLAIFKQHSPLQVSTFQGNEDLEPQTGSASIIKDPFLPWYASEKEQRIYAFLNKMNAFQINVKEMMDEE